MVGDIDQAPQRVAVCGFGAAWQLSFCGLQVGEAIGNGKHQQALAGSGSHDLSGALHILQAQPVRDEADRAVIAI